MSKVTCMNIPASIKRIETHRQPGRFANPDDLGMNIPASIKRIETRRRNLGGRRSRNV